MLNMTTNISLTSADMPTNTKELNDSDLLHMLLIPTDSDEADLCGRINTFSELYLYALINVCGFVLNLVCALVYCRLMRVRKKPRDCMDLYLFLKSLVDVYLSVRNGIFFLVDNNSWRMHSVFAVRVAEWILIIYVGFVAQFISLAFELLANFDRFRTITQSMQLFNKIPNKVIIGALLAYSCAFYLYKFYEYEFVYDPDQAAFRITSSDLGVSTSWIWIFNFVHSVVRDCLFGLIIIVLNVLTVSKMKQALKNNRKLTNRTPHSRPTVATSNTATGTGSSSVDAAVAHLLLAGVVDKLTNGVKSAATTTTTNGAALNKKSKNGISGAGSNSNSTASVVKSRMLLRKEKQEQRITIMMLLTSTVAVVAHGYYFVYYFPTRAFNINSCVSFLGNLGYMMSYTANFFFYYFLNKNFHKTLLDSISCRYSGQQQRQHYLQQLVMNATNVSQLNITGIETSRL